MRHSFIHHRVGTRSARQIVKIGKSKKAGSFLIGVLSDTHGLLRPEALRALKGVDGLIHSGDIGDPELIERLRSIAPVAAVKGNNDRGPWTRHLPEEMAVEVGKIMIYVLHDLKDLIFDPHAAGLRVVISGHSHRPSVHEQNGVLFVNPGSAGPRRFKLPVAVARLRIKDRSARARIVELDV